MTKAKPTCYHATSALRTQYTVVLFDLCCFFSPSSKLEGRHERHSLGSSRIATLRFVFETLIDYAFRWAL
ncbi:hypothetical protein I7I50_06515 [Histoplasma capsulatum G186AR]|uniref:Uncharacterized protein n=1 Tax=Ajellomyces capsulatus TaxID=5037 RepID=A0A8H7YZE7_AJECA|nr:hypothetical protein I7I52_10414 [Histoplasma capsulatum]QSS67436.1 hypothetical protein I7I50_06515 [Histoplasma capsulatum G186AR]